MNYNEVLELAKKRRNIRRFKPDPVSDQQIQQILEVAHWAPSGANGQPWLFIVIKEQATKDAIAEAFLKIRPEHYYMEQSRVEAIRHNNMLTPPVDIPPWTRAPVIVLVLGDRRTAQASVLAGTFIGNGGTVDGTYQKGMANVTLLMQLAATSLGLGAQWQSVTDDWANLMRPILDIPPFMHIHHLVPIGYPDYESKPGYRRNLEEMVHYEKYEMSKHRTGAQILEYIQQLRGRTRPAYDVQQANMPKVKGH